MNRENTHPIPTPDQQVAAVTRFKGAPVLLEPALELVAGHSPNSNNTSVKKATVMKHLFSRVRLMGRPVDWETRSSLRSASRNALSSSTASLTSREKRSQKGRKVCAQLSLSISPISERLRLRSIGRLPKVAARQADRGPYSLIVFGTGGRRSPLFAPNAPSYGGGSLFARRAR